MVEMLPKLLILLFSIVLHEIAHGYAALRQGDPTARDAGRLTLNLIPHIDLVGTLLLPGFLILTGSPVLFGWAKPVPINPYNFRDPKMGTAIVGIAGPVTNVILAVIAALIFRIALAATPGGGGMHLQLLAYGVAINIVLATFNLVPIPPLDGSRVIAPFLPQNVALIYRQLEPYGFFIIFGLLYMGFFRYVIGPIYQFVAGILLGF